VDASHNIHFHNKLQGQTGIVVTVGQRNAPVYVKSSKQRVTSRSSTESELIALDSALQHILWFKEVCSFIGYPQHPVHVFQDNRSTMSVCESGLSKSGRIKHMAARYFFIKQHIDSGTVLLHYVQSENMLADSLTKPLSGDPFVKARKLLLNA